MVKQLSVFSSNTSEMFCSIGPKSKNSGVRFLLEKKNKQENLLFIRIIFPLSGVI